MMTSITIGTDGMTLKDVVAVARHGATVSIAPEAIETMRRTRAIVDSLADEPNPVYGVSTGFGALAQHHIPHEMRQQLQLALIRSHAAGIGPEVEKEVVRALMLLRLKNLCSGRCGVRPDVAQTMADLINAHITPIVLDHGSLGCSGDLAPLAHCAMVLIGEGRARDGSGVERPVPELLAAAGIAPIVLQEKEGLALINGTDGMLGMLILALADLDGLVDMADLTAAMSVEGLHGTDNVFRPELHEPLRPHPGQAVSAAAIYNALQGSAIVADRHNRGDLVQDAYSLRCAPQVNGGLRDTIQYARSVAEQELAAQIDNPVVLSDGTVSSNGNFHGAPVGYVLDFLAIPIADVASMSERRTDRMLDSNRSRGLPAFLAENPGVDSGLMIAHYTQAALVAESKRLAVPATVDSIPTSAMQEDHVSLGWHAARKLRKVIDALAEVLAIELMTAARAIDLRAPLTPGSRIATVITELRESVPGPGPDRFLHPEIQAAVAFVRQRMTKGDL